MLAPYFCDCRRSFRAGWHLSGRLVWSGWRWQRLARGALSSSRFTRQLLSAGLHPHPCPDPNPNPNPHSIPISGRAGEIFSDGLDFPSPVSSSDAMIRDDGVHAAVLRALSLQAAWVAVLVQARSCLSASSVPEGIQPPAHLCGNMRGDCCCWVLNVAACVLSFIQQGRLMYHYAIINLVAAPEVRSLCHHAPCCYYGSLLCSACLPAAGVAAWLPCVVCVNSLQLLL